MKNLPKKILPNRHYVMLIEVVFAMGLLLMLSSVFMASMRSVHNLNNLVVAEAQAVQVADNTVERLAAMPGYSAAQVKAVFMDEYAKSSLPIAKKITPQITEQPNQLLLQFIKPNGKQLLEVKIPCNQ
jgi:hypothetical protein